MKQQQTVEKSYQFDEYFALCPKIKLKMLQISCLMSYGPKSLDILTLKLCRKRFV